MNQGELLPRMHESMCGREGHLLEWFWLTIILTFYSYFRNFFNIFYFSMYYMGALLWNFFQKYLLWMAHYLWAGGGDFYFEAAKNKCPPPWKFF